MAPSVDTVVSATLPIEWNPCSEDAQHISWLWRGISDIVGHLPRVCTVQALELLTQPVEIMAMLGDGLVNKIVGLGSLVPAKGTIRTDCKARPAIVCRSIGMLMH